MILLTHLDKSSSLSVLALDLSLTVGATLEFVLLLVLASQIVLRKIEGWLRRGCMFVKSKRRNQNELPHGAKQLSLLKPLRAETILERWLSNQKENSVELYPPTLRRPLKTQ